MYLPCPILSVSFEEFSSRKFITDLLSPQRSVTVPIESSLSLIFMQRHASDGGYGRCFRWRGTKPMPVQALENFAMS